MKLSFAVIALLIAAGCVREGPTAGRMLYAEHCAACHGPRAKGDGRAASGLATLPPDLTRIAERRNGVWPMLEVMSIVDGYAKRINPREDMPVIRAFREGRLVKFETGNGQASRAPENLLAVVRYLETIQSPEPTSYVP